MPASQAAVRHRPLHWLGADPVPPHSEKKGVMKLRTRDVTITVRCTEDERRKIRELAAESKLKDVQNSDSITSAAIDTVGDIAALVTLIEDNDEDEDKHYSTVDRKRLKEEWEKKESLGMHMG